jgi:hypothetical protein
LSGRHAADRRYHGGRMPALRGHRHDIKKQTSLSKIRRPGREPRF